MPTRTPSGKKTALADVEGKLKAEYGTKTPAARARVYGTLNKVGLLQGNKPTKKGLRAASKKGR